MKMRLKILMLCALALMLVWLLWPAGGNHAPATAKTALASTSSPSHPSVHPLVTAAPKQLFADASATNNASAKTNRLAYRLSNTPQTIGQLAADRHAILLDNALIETDAKADLKIPAHLRASGEPGAFIVQARGVTGAAFRAALVAAGGEIVSYIPNNAYLVRLSATGAAGLAGNPLVQTVLPYAPYFKVQSSLLGLAVEQKPLPSETYLTLGLFADSAAATETEIQKLGGEILSRDRSPFGPIVRLRPPANWIALAQLPGVQLVEPAHRRAAANDLSRVSVGVSMNTLTNANWLGLSGSNVVVEVNDTGIDATHPDFTTGGNPTTAGGAPIRVIGDSTNSLVDIDGHGTHVAGIIAGNGSKSINPTNVGAMASGSVTNADFRGKAPLATLFSVGWLGPNDFGVSDEYLQETPAKTNALISNNSWNYGAGGYDLAAASYDAAVRDALPAVTGPQPVLFVFAAGNSGSGDNNGGNGTSDSILSPATAKNVITVGAVEQSRFITNTYLPLYTTNPDAVWYPETDTSSQVAWFSSRGNVGIGTEGTYGRFKPDVVAPGTFVVSTRSSTWDQAAYYNPTNHYGKTIQNEYITTNGLNYYSFSDFGLVVKSNTVGISIQITNVSPSVTNLPIYLAVNYFPDSSNNVFTTNNSVTIPPDAGGETFILSAANNFGDFNFTIGNTNPSPVTYNLLVTMVTTNDMGNYYTVLSNLNDTLGPYYRYESGTSMAAADVSGVLALMQDYFTNTLKTTPSPALLKAMLINGARPTGFYNFQVNNSENFEGWGLINLTNSLPSAITNQTAGPNNSFYYIDQSATNALATGDSRTYKITLSPGAAAAPLRLTLAWTDPPGNPAAAIKLVNDLDLIVTNLDNPTNPVIFYGNDIGAGQVFNTPENTNAVVTLDAVNNVKNVYLPAGVGTNFTIVVSGTAVNVNAVTTQTNTAAGVYAPNVVQDFALVIASGNGSGTNGFAINSVTAAANPTGDQRITFVTGTNSALLNQFVGAASPVMVTNTVPFGTNSPYATNALVFIGQTNQWHFYIVTNNGPAADYTNAAFVTFLPPTLAIPREGVFAGSDAKSTRPEADIDLYVASGPGAYALTNLDPTIISNCIHSTQVGVSSGGVFYGAALDRGGTEFVVDTNSTAGTQVYYVGVKSEDQMASEYSFIAEFSNVPFSQMDSNGNESVTFFPVAIPDGDPTTPGYTNTLGLALYPVEIGKVVVTNVLAQQNVGDLVVSLSHTSVANGNSKVGLLYHDSPNTPGIYTNIYDDNNQTNQATTQHSDGPGSLNDFIKQQGQGVWILHAADSAPGFIGSISSSMFIEKHQTTNGLIRVTVPALSWYYDYVTVPVGYTNLLVVATNLPPNSTPAIRLYLNYNTEPTFSNYLAEVDLTNSPFGPGGLYPGNSISYGPPLTPGTYWVGIYNPDNVSHDVLYGAFLSFNASAISTVDYASTGSVPLLDDAVTTDSIAVTNTDVIQGIKVGLRVDHPRISDLVFHLISPDGSRYLLMENRGADSTNGCGLTVITTNIFTATASGTAQPNTNYINVGTTSGTFPINFNFYTAPDQMIVYYGTNPATFSSNSSYVAYNTGVISNAPLPVFNNPQDTYSSNIIVSFPPPGVPAASTWLTIVMDQYLSTNRADFWTYTAGGVFTNYEYLSFTEDTNLTTTPIKFAPPPLVPQSQFYVATNFVGTNNVVVTNTVITNLYYQAEQSLSPLVGTSAAGNWELEVLDNRAGASNNTTLVSWQLEFAFANTNFTIPVLTLTNGIAQTNFVPGGAIAWYQVNVPTNADYATNLLLFANPSLTMWFSTNTPPTITTLSDVALLVNSAGGTNLIGTNGSLVNVNPPAYLVPGGIYYLGIQNPNVSSASYAVQVNFDLLPTGTAASINTLAATNITATNATLQALANAGGVPMTVFFNYSLSSTNLNLTSSFVQLTNNLNVAQNIGIGVTGLLPGNIYFIQAEATNVVGTNYGAVLTFTNLPLPPAVLTLAATNIGTTNATLTAAVNPNGATTTAYFNYGTTTNYGTVLGFTLLTNNLNSSQFVGLTFSNLNPNTVYHYQAVATNLAGTNFGSDLVFTTAQVPEALAFTEPASAVTGLGAQLNGFIAANGNPTLAWFEYGTNTLYGQITLPVAVGSPTNIFFVTSAVTNLTYGMPYHFRLIASNAVGVVRGFDHVFGVGSVVAWGQNNFGQTNVPAGLTNVVAVAGTDTASLALKADGTVVAWGGINGETNIPSGATNIVSIAAAAANCMALRSDGTVLAWGQNNLLTTSMSAVANQLTNVVGLAVGYQTGIALRNDGSVVSWGQTPIVLSATNEIAAVASGYNFLPPLSGNSEEAITAGGVEFAFFDSGSAYSINWTNVVALSGYSGYFGTNLYTAAHTLALRGDGTILDPPTYITYNNNLAPAGNNFEMVAAGGNHGLAQTVAGGVMVWGDNTFGQTNLPANLTNNVVAIGAGAQHSLAVQSGRPTGPLSPSLFTLAATNITPNGGSLQAAVDPNGTATTVFFNYGITTNYGSVSTSLLLTNNLSLTNFISIDISSLLPGTTYHFQVIATNVIGTNFGGDLSFTTLTNAPFAHTVPATLQNGASAQLNGFASPNGGTAYAWFEWGTTTAYGNTTTVTNAGNGNGANFTSAVITGLTTNQPYHFRLVVSNAVGVARGYDQVFNQATVIGWGTYGGITVPFGLNNVIGIAAGFDFGAALNYNGTVTAWGGNFWGQSSIPTNLANVVSIAAGGEFGLALLANGTVTGWGYNVWGQYNPPVNATNTVVIAVGYDHTLAVQNNGTLLAWGYNSVGQATVPAGLSNIVAVAGGGYFTVALKDDGTVIAWGDNSSGQTNVPPGLTNVVSVAASANHVLALRNDGTVVAWGDNSLGQTNVPAGLTNVAAIAAGLSNSVALTLTGAVISWGGNNYGQTNVPPSLATNTTAIASGDYLGLALSSASYAFTLPATAVTGTSAQLNGFVAANGHPTTAWFEWDTNANYSHSTPLVPVGSSYNVFYLTNPINGLTYGTPYRYRLVISNLLGTVRGFDHVFGVGQVVAWGDNGFGQTNVPTGLTNVVAVAGSYDASLALKTDGSIAAWGQAFWGETTIPANATNVVAIAAGDRHCLALRADGTVVAWGDNIFGEATVPTGLSNVVAVAGAYLTSLALKSDGNVVTWGYYATSSTQLTNSTVAISGGSIVSVGLGVDGTFYQIPSWVVSPSWNNMVALSGLAQHAVALKNDQTISDWLQYVTYTNALVPTGNNFEMVAAGANHGLAQTVDGTAVAWGDNSSGQTNVPPGLTNVIAITAGANHNLVVQSFTPLSGPYPVAKSVAAPAGNFSFAIAKINRPGFTLQWSTSASGTFQVQWKTNLTAVWNTITNPATTTANGVSTFTDTGTQTAPLGPTRFYRLVWVP